VFITGLNEGILPHQRSLEDAEEMAEERRLMYVGVTRAKDRLFLTRPFRQTIYGSYEMTAPSRFLEDIPEKLVAGQFVKKQAANDSAYARMTTWGEVDTTEPEPVMNRPKPARPAAREVVATDAKFRTGQRVKHATFGEGMIIESKGSGDNEIVVIAFEGTGIKRLAANMVELKVLKG
jgi:DNA helicase-2/ATP-dependent DNA helicase PcrA